MKYAKSILAVGIVFLLLAGSLPVLAAPTPSLSDQEASAAQVLFDRIDQAAASSHSIQEFMGKLREICKSTLLDRFPDLKALFDRIRTFANRNPRFYLFGIPLGSNLGSNLGSALGSRATSHFVLSYGVYHRYNPLRQNSFTFMKDRLSGWHYRSTNLFKGRTLILNRHPFGIGKRVIGPQVGLLRGFRGIYIDHESKLTGNSYLFFIGNADHVRAFSLTPFK